MIDVDIAMYRVEALNLAYGILNQKFAAQASRPGPTSALALPPTTEQVLEEAKKLSAFIEV